MSTRVWVLGDAVVDLLPESQGRLLQCPGGAPANVAVGIARLGGKSAFIGKVGDDPFGRFMYQTLSTENVDTRYMSLDPQHRTSIVAVGLDEQGERNFTFMVRPSADLFLQPDGLPAFGPGEWLHLCSIALSAEPSRSTAFLAMEKIRQAGGNISFDPNIRSDLWQSEALLRKYLDRALSLANIAKLSEEELLFISGESQVQQGAYSLVQRYSLTLLLITQGKNGVLVYFQGQFIHYPAKPVSVVDTTGAGDAFVAGLLAGL
ncbi:aminoimidazole riboside kinase, partial [Escherichia coli]|nr:aminoimidazole riboside kinase [Escherichia coli]